MKKILSYLFEHKTLSREAARDVFVNISSGLYNETEIASFTTVYLMRSITIEELSGFRDALKELCVKADLKGELIDIVGTGGDNKNTFNISTISSFIVAGAGIKVAKHGNYGATSISGSSNVMEQLGYKFTNDQNQLQHQLETSNICFLHAPLFHPALKIVAPMRRNLGIRTFFNMLGPLVNPADPDFQLIGVFNMEMARTYNYLMQNSGRNYTIIHTLDGYDEISLTEDCRVITRSGEKVFSPQFLGKRAVSPADLFGGNTVEDAARIFLKILKGEGSWPQNAVVLANASMAIHSTGVATYEESYLRAIESLESGKALHYLKQLTS